MIYEIRGKEVMLNSDLAKLYHRGTSLNRIGYKTFSINIINDNDVCRLLINKIYFFKQ